MSWGGARWDNRAKPCNKLPGDVSTGLESALSNLSTSLTINGVTKTPSLLIYGSNITTALATATYGDNMAIAGAGTDPVVDGETPLISTTDKSVVWGVGSKYYVAPDNDNWSFGLDDIVVEAVGQVGNTAGGEIICGKLSGADRCELQSTATAYRMSWSIGGVGSLTVTAGGASGTNTPGAWIHCIFFLDRSGNGIGYINGNAGSVLDISAYVASTMTIATTASLGSRKGAADFTEGLAYVATWQGTNWLDTHDQSAIALARAKALYGSNTDETRDSAAYLHKPVSSAQKYFLVGRDWMRLAQDLTGNPYYLDEAASTNLIDETSHDLSAWNAPVGTTVALEAGALSPQASVISEDASTGAHVVRTNNTISVENGSIYTMWMLVEAETRDQFFFQLELGGDLVRATCNLTAETAIATAVDDWGSESASITDLGDNLYLVSVTGTVTGPTQNVAAEIWLLNDSGDFSYAGNSSEALKVHHVQVEQASAPTSPIDCLTTANVTRDADA